MKQYPFYPHSRGEAIQRDEMNLYVQSLMGNIRCSEAIGQTISDNYQNNCLGKDLARGIMETHGYDRTAYVLANHVQHYDYDGRISRENKAWAKTISVSKDENNPLYLVDGGVHIGLVDLFVNQYRKTYESLNLWDKSQVNSPDGLDFEHRILVLKSDRLKDQNRTRDEQLFYAIGGFGCISGKGGKVMGEFLVDDEPCHWYRYDFLGEAKPEFLPQWAKEKLQELGKLLANEDLAMAILPSQGKTSVLEKLQAKGTPGKIVPQKEMER